MGHLMCKFRARKTGQTALVNISKVLEVVQKDFPDGTSISVRFPRNVYDPEASKLHYTTLADGLDRDVAELVVNAISEALARGSPLVDINELVRVAKVVAATGGTCPEEVEV